MKEVITCGCGCQLWYLSYGKMECSRCGFIFGGILLILQNTKVINNSIKANYLEQPHPMLCVEHGGSSKCEESNKKLGFECPKCKTS